MGEEESVPAHYYESGWVCYPVLPMAAVCYHLQKPFSKEDL